MNFIALLQALKEIKDAWTAGDYKGVFHGIVKVLDLINNTLPTEPIRMMGADGTDHSEAVKSAIADLEDCLVAPRMTADGSALTAFLIAFAEREIPALIAFLKAYFGV